MSDAFDFLTDPILWREPKNRDSDDNGNHPDGVGENLLACGSSKYQKTSNESFDPEYDLIVNPFMVRALEVIKFNILFDEISDETEIITKTFTPTMAHQIFGSEEVITGYRNLLIKFSILPNSFNTLMEYSYTEIAHNPIRWEIADDIEDKLKDWFPHLVKPDVFAKLKECEDLMKIHGDIVLTFPIFDKNNVSSNVYITKCDPADKNFMEYHKRFQALIVFFIDAASIIEYSDPNWVYYYVYKDILKDGKVIARLPIGFCTVYKFTLSKRARVSQFFILPNFQQRGLGLRLLGFIYREFQSQDEFKFITVECPCEEFSNLRDKLDLSFIIHFSEFAKDKILEGYTPAMGVMAQKRWKLTCEQVKHLVDVLRCYYTKTDPEQREMFIRNLKLNSYNNYKKKLTKLSSKAAKEERIARLKRIVDDDYMLNRTIHRDVVNYVKNMMPHMKYIETLLSKVSRG